MKNTFIQVQKNAFSIGCGFLVVAVITSVWPSVKSGLGSIYVIVTQMEWLVVILCFGTSGLFGLSIIADVRNLIKKRTEGRNADDFTDEH